ncbi:hypothetical protein FOA52_004361 [Chlamydomonas sp. UWO 241]|nr:hypothetical protein FOA52_004361 [Chlamydomonas sp. UWO 241]
MADDVAAARGEFSRVPIIDVSPLTQISDAPTDARAVERVATEVGAACRDVGFFYVTGHGISEELQLRLERLSTQFFSRPLEQKREIGMSKGGKAWRGFFACGEELTKGIPDIKEGINA